MHTLYCHRLLFYDNAISQALLEKNPTKKVHFCNFEKESSKSTALSYNRQGPTNHDHSPRSSSPSPFFAALPLSPPPTPFCVSPPLFSLFFSRYTLFFPPDTLSLSYFSIHLLSASKSIFIHSAFGCIFVSSPPPPPHTHTPRLPVLKPLSSN